MTKLHDEVLAANAAYARDFGDKSKLAMPPARRFAILTCMDARLDPAKFAGLAEGDAHVIRNAGGRASDDAIRSLVISHKLLGTKEWFVIHHTDCGMETFTDEVMRGLLRQSLDTAEIGPDGWKDVGKGPGSAEGDFIDWLTIEDQAESVTADVKRIRSHPLVPRGVPVYGYIYDVKSGKLIEVPAVPYRDPNNYVRYSGRLAEELARTLPNGAIWANQFDNVANRDGHIRTTGPEIWRQTEGKIDAFVSAVGTGGTLAGVGIALKERNRDVKIVLADPDGAALYNYYAHGELKAEGSSITEGIGQGRITANLEGAPVDMWFNIKDEEALPLIFDLVVDEGLVLGGSTGINLAGAIRTAKELGPGHVIVTVLCDYGNRYQSKMFNPDFLREKGLPVPQWLERRRTDVPDVRL